MGLKKLNNEQIISRAKEIHGDKYDYSKVEYKNMNTKVIIICPEHGEFEQRIDMHLRGQGCKKCGLKSMSRKITKTTDQFIKEAKEIHEDKYDYSKTKYINSEEKVIIICPEHGEFEQTPMNHLLGKGCKKCANEKLSKFFIDTTETFINKAKEIHEDKYDYSKVEYKKSQEKVIIICPEHGEFEQIPSNHIVGMGCPKCSHKISKPEIEIQQLFDIDNVITNDRQILDGFELDIYIPEKQIAIEFNGLYWHNEINKPNKNYHLKKTELCESKGIQLIHIFEDEWLFKQDIVKSRINNLLKLNTNKIYGRKCEIKFVDTNDSRKFLNENHIQGYVNSQYSYGLYYQDELVSLMTFGKLRKNLGNIPKEGEFELLRFCNKLNTTVIGSASKLFFHFLKAHKPKRIISYADRRWSTGNLYNVLGFKHKHNSNPNYFYVIGNKRENRFNFRKDILISKYNCKHEDTEHNFCFNQGWYRIYDCGTKVYEYNIK